MGVSNDYYAGSIAKQASDAVDDANWQVKDADSSNEGVRPSAGRAWRVSAFAFTGAYCKLYPAREKAARAIAESEHHGGSLKDLRKACQDLAKSLIHTSVLASSADREQLVDLSANLRRIIVNVEMKSSLFFEEHDRILAAREMLEVELAAVLSLLILALRSIDTALLAESDFSREENNYENEVVVVDRAMFLTFFHHLNQVLKLGVRGIGLFDGHDWAEGVLRSSSGPNIAASYYMQRAFDQVVDACGDWVELDEFAASFMPDYCAVGRRLGRRGYHAYAALVLEQYWDRSAMGDLPPMDPASADVLGSCFLRVGRTEAAASVLSSILYDGRWSNGRERARQSAENSDDCDDPMALRNQPTWLYKAHCNLATALGVLSKDYHRAALAQSSPTALKGVPSNANATAARALRSIALKETGRALRLGEDGLAATLIRATLKYDEYLASDPLYGTTAVKSLRSAYALMTSICQSDQVSQSRGLIELQYATIVLDYLGECAESGCEVGGTSNSESTEDFRSWFLSSFHDLAKMWIRNQRFLKGKMSLHAGTNEILVTYERGLASSFDDDVLFESLAALLSIRLRTRKIQRSLLCSFDDGSGAKRRLAKRNALVECLERKEWGDDDVRALNALAKLDVHAGEAGEHPDIVYYTSTENACRLFEDLYYPDAIDFPMVRSACLAEGVSDRDLGAACNCLTLMHASYMNDPSEGSALFKALKAKGNANIYKLTPSDFRDSVFDQSFVFIKSFSSCADQLHMWSMYGRGSNGLDSAGCCVSFAPITFCSGPAPFVDLSMQGLSDVCVLSCLQGSDDFDLYRIAYISDESGEFRFVDSDKGNGKGILSESVDVIGEKICEIEAVTNGALMKRNERLITKLLAEILFLFKDGSYRREEEMRLIVLRDSSDMGRSEICPIPKSGSVPWYCVKPFKQVYVDKMILGPKADDAHTIIPHLQYELARMRDKAAENGVRIAPSVTKSSIPYR